ncbi:MAG: 4Fe-4S dicluster domain-containing protein [Candidatus Kuenenia sp.]|nr:4Fe-4S dicluster domain-containing protein [Candidatus Kuenenia sp.]
MAVIKIKENYCKGCLLCIPVCHHNSLVISENLNDQGLHPVRFKEDGKCDGCKKCAIICPDVAIEIYN